MAMSHQAHLRICVAAMLIPVVLGILAQLLLVSKRDLRTGLIVWVIALAAFIFLARSLSRQKARVKSLPEKITARMEIALCLLVLAVGAFFILYKIGSIPPGLNHDAAWEGLLAIQIIQEGKYVPFVAAGWGYETMFQYIIALNHALIGPQKFAVQLAAIMVGISTLVTFLVFMRRLVGAPTAIIATLLLGVNGWHMTFSRLGWRAILVPLFICLVFFFLVKAIEKRRMRDFLLAGIALGLSIGTYGAARMIPFMVGAYLLYEFVREPHLFRTSYKGLLVFAIAALVAFAPLGWYALNHWNLFASRSEYLFIGNQIQQIGTLDPLFANIKSALLAFNYKGNGDDFFITEPLLDSPVSVFFIFGLAIALARWRQRPYFLILTILMLTLTVGILSKPNGNHIIGAIIPVVACAGISLNEAWRWARIAWPAQKKQIACVFVLVLVSTAYITYDSYLGPNRRTQWGHYPEATRVGTYMGGIANEYEIHVAAGNWPRETLKYLTYPGSGDPFTPIFTYTTNATELLTHTTSAEKGTAFIIEAVPENKPVFEALSQQFAESRRENVYYGDKHVAHVLLIPPRASAEVATAEQNKRFIY